MTKLAQEEPAPAPPKTTFRVTTYYKRPRGQHGITQLASQRLMLGEALDWILSEIPENAITITPDTEGENDAVTVRIDWTKIPAEVRTGS